MGRIRHKTAVIHANFVFDNFIQFFIHRKNEILIFLFISSKVMVLIGIIFKIVKFKIVVLNKILGFPAYYAPLARNSVQTYNDHR